MESTQRRRHASVGVLLAVVGAFVAAPAQAGYTRTTVHRAGPPVGVRSVTTVRAGAPVGRSVTVVNGGGCCYHPVATGVAVAATAVAVGTIVHSLPPSCTTVVTAGVTYQQCGNAWYQPQYAGSQVTYVAVHAP